MIEFPCIRPRKNLSSKTHPTPLNSEFSFLFLYFLLKEKQQAFHHVRSFSLINFSLRSFTSRTEKRKMKIENQRSEQRHYIKSLFSSECVKDSSSVYVSSLTMLKRRKRKITIHVQTAENLFFTLKIAIFLYRFFDGPMKKEV